MIYSPSELITISAARKLHDGCSVFAGVGLPLLAGILAKRMHAPSLQMVVEGGIIDPEVIPGRLPYSTNEMRLAPRATMLPGITDTFLLAQRGFLDFGFVSGAQIDRYGNLNSSVIGPHDRPTVRLPGSGGANDIASLCRQTIVLTVHEKRRLVPAVDFLTSPGFLQGADSRRQAGLVFGKLAAIVTNLALLGFDEPDRRIRIDALQPGASVEQVRDETGFELVLPRHLTVAEPPSETELAALRSIDPDGVWL
ncbi:MAG TPA: CoA-transferase [Chloroflexota bacterium]